MIEIKRVPLKECELFASKCGLIYKQSRSGFLRPIKQQDRQGYRRTRVWLKGCRRYQSYSIHRLVAMAWIGPPTKNKPFINHKDGNRSNNHTLNLEWVSRIENMTHAGRVLRRGPGFKLSEKQISEIKEKYQKQKPTLKSLAEQFGVSSVTISNILCGQIYAGIGINTNLRARKRRAKLTLEQVREIKAKLSSQSNAELAKQYQVNKATIYDIRARKTWIDA